MDSRQIHLAKFNADVEINHKHHNKRDIEYIHTGIGFHTNWILNFIMTWIRAAYNFAAQFSVALLKTGSDVFIITVSFVEFIWGVLI